MSQKGKITSMASGFGTITSEGGEQILFDVTKCKYEGPEAGDEVEFDVKQGWDGKPRAINVDCPTKGSKAE